jgi:hypothetical protein
MRCVSGANGTAMILRQPSAWTSSFAENMSLLYAKRCTASYVGELALDLLRLEEQSQHHNHSSRHGVWFQGCIVSVKS